MAIYIYIIYDSGGYVKKKKESFIGNPHFYIINIMKKIFIIVINLIKKFSFFGLRSRYAYDKKYYDDNENHK